jgi:hypothetical protein
MMLQGQRCRVRSWQSSDADAIARHANNVNVAKQLRDRFPHPYTRADAVAFLRFAASAERETNLAIEVEGEAAGASAFPPRLATGWASTTGAAAS